MEGHKIILKDLLNVIKDKNIKSILDAGSGRTSLSIITKTFSDIPIDAIIYPGDGRKLNSIKGITDLYKNINVTEKDICCDIMDKKYDLIVAHLLLGEAAKFGNTFDDLLEKIITMRCMYLIIIDYLEDPKVSEADIVKMCGANNLMIIYKSYFTNDNPQVWNDFVGVHNFGYLIKRL